MSTDSCAYVDLMFPAQHHTTEALQTSRSAHLDQCLSHSSLQSCLSFRDPRGIVPFGYLGRLVSQHLGQILHAGATQKLSDSKGVTQLVRVKFHGCSIVLRDGE